MKISVIVPAYNAEPYLEQCSQSILMQSYKDIELIIVDDGSIDRTPTICDSIADEDDRVRVFHISNGGPGHARNYGLNQVTGEYVLFVDADDLLAKDALNTLVSRIGPNRCDLVCFNFDVISSSKGVTRRSLVKNDFPSCEYSDSREVLKYIYNHNLENYSWCFLYNINAIHKYGLRFDNRFVSLEDMVMLNHFLRNPLKVLYLNQALYHYRDNQSSITHQLSYKTIWDTSYAIADVIGLFDMDKDSYSTPFFCTAFYHMIISDDRRILRMHKELDVFRRHLMNHIYDRLYPKRVKDKVMMSLYRIHLSQFIWKTTVRIRNLCRRRTH